MTTILTSMQIIAPQTMKVAIATGFGGIDENIHVREGWPVPCLDDYGQGFLLVRILACALAPGDVRLLSGKTDYVQLPASGHPYIVGEKRVGFCGTVECRVYNV
jgi:NADPH:quinone reductase-like Zn-dependent oxidoreductase